MIATINGAVVSGTPEEIQQLITLNNTSVVTASSTTESAKKEETPDPYGYGRCEVPVGYAVMREKQAVADYKKRLIEKFKKEANELRRRGFEICAAATNDVIKLIEVED